MKFTSIGTPLGIALLACCALAQATEATGPMAAPSAEVTPEVPAAEKRWTTEERLAEVEKLIAVPLSVNGIEISPAAIRRTILRDVGSVRLKFAKLDLLIDAELDRRKAAGEDVSVFTLTEEEEQALTSKELAKVTAQYPDEPLEEVLAKNNLSVEGLKRQVLQTKRFDDIFLPVTGAVWPEMTMNALRGKMDDALIAGMRSNWIASAAGKGDPSGVMFNQMIRSMVLKKLMDGAEVSTAADGLPVPVALRVNGHDLMVADIWPEIAILVHPEEVQRARQYLARTIAVQQELVAKGAWLSDKDFNVIFDAEKKIGEGSPWDLSMIVLSMKRYPTMSFYQEILRAERSYERMIQAELTDATLRAWLPRAERFLGLGEVKSEVILLSVFDYVRNDWRDDAWADAEQRANAVVEALVESGGENWDALLDAHSDLVDLPMGEVAEGAPAAKMRNKGRLGRLHRTPLMQLLAESEYSTFVDGSSISDQIYYNQEVGIDGPFKGIHGYYITRVESRTSPKKIELSDPNMRKMVTEDYVMHHFMEFSNVALEAARVIGL